MMETTRIASINVRGKTHKRTLVFRWLKHYISYKKHTQQRLQQNVGKINDLENVSLVEQVQIVKGLLYLYIPIVILTLSTSEGVAILIHPDCNIDIVK